jgi:type IV secretory pathway VirB10-like protein
MMGLVLAGTMVLTPQGRGYIQPMGHGSYNVWSSNGITQVRDFGGWTQVKTPDGSTTSIWPDSEQAMPVLPVLPVEVEDGE